MTPAAAPEHDGTDHDHDEDGYAGPAALTVDGAEYAVAYSSGMAAIDVVLRVLLKPGDHIVVSNDAYGGTYRLIQQVFTQWGVDNTVVDMTDPEAVAAAVQDNTKVIWVETPTNPMLGIAAFSVVIVTGVLAVAGVRLPRWYWAGLAGGTRLGAVFVHWLIYQSLYEIGALCPYCMVVWAAMIPISSISAGEACPTAWPMAQRRRRGTMATRAAGVSSLESRTPAGALRQVSSMTTTPTVTGPARAPRPTSSMPASTR